MTAHLKVVFGILGKIISFTLCQSLYCFECNLVCCQLSPVFCCCLCVSLLGMLYKIRLQAGVPMI
jgi:hypothetical protein